MKIQVKGYIGSDAKLTKFGDRDSDYVCSFSLAEHNKRKGANGENITVTTWHRVTLWYNFAKAMAPYLTKGRKVDVEGTLGKVETFTRGNTIESVVNIYAKEIDLDSPKQTEAPAMPEATAADLAAEAPADEVAPWEQP